MNFCNIFLILQPLIQIVDLMHYFHSYGTLWKTKNSKSDRRKKFFYQQSVKTKKFWL